MTVRLIPSKHRDIESSKEMNAMSLHIVDDDKIIVEDKSQRLRGSVVNPVPLRSLVRPLAVRVSRPIPQRVSKQFYDEIFQEGLTLTETSQAAAMAHEWHRKWTQQDERNHTNTEEDFYSSNMLAQDQLNVDRQGARNPLLIVSEDSTQSSILEVVKRTLHADASSRSASPSGNSFMLFNPEDRLSASSWCDESSLSSHMEPQVKRRFVDNTGEAVLSDHEQFAPISIRPQAVRPSALRPLANRPMFAETQVGIPQNIVATRRYGNVSPMSCAGVSSRFGPPEMTDPKEQNVNVVENCEEDSSSVSSKTRTPISPAISVARDDLLHSLAVTQGDVNSPKFKKSLDPLLQYFSQTELDGQPHVIKKTMDGMWLTLSKPSFFGSLGENDSGDPMYTLGRMSFDMFSPTNLVCSLQGNFNPVEVVTDDERKKMLECVPKALREEVESGKTVLRTYHIVTAFTIEPASAAFPISPNKDVRRPIKGIMTTYGYCLPDPNVMHRHSIWITGGRIEPNNNPSDISDWKRLFALHPPKHSFGEKAKLLAVKLLMGATIPDSVNKDGSMEYTFTRPIGGHGIAFVDLVYLDETLRIVRGHRGTIFVFSRIQQKHD